MEPLFANTLLFGEEILNRMHIAAGSWLDVVMPVITATGSETFYMVALPVLYWCWDRRKTLYVGAVFLTAMSVNDVLKNIFNHPRPDPANLLPGIRELASRYMPAGPGFPSGHAQGSVSFWGTIALLAGTATTRIICLAMILLVSYSRLYLGVHFLGDVIGGFILGILCLIVIIPAATISEKHYHSINPVFLTVVLIVLPIIIYAALPGIHISNNMGAISGFLIGALLGEERIRFNPRNRLPYQAAKVVIGIAVVAAIRFGLKAVLPDTQGADFFRYWCVGFWCSFGAPFIFGKFSSLRGWILN